MLQNIREIGIFMIVAQAVVHFAPGRQYEKYIKSIASVIIVLLFLKPFVQGAEGGGQALSTILGRWEESSGLSDRLEVSAAVSASSVESAVKRRMEEEIAAFLNRELAGEACSVKQVTLVLEEEAVFSMTVLLGERETGENAVTVDTVTIGAGRARLQNREEMETAYRQRFAGLLELAEERVEVRWDE